MYDAYPIVTHLYFKDDVINNVSHFFLSICWRWCVKDTQEWHHAKRGMATVLPVPNRMPCFSAFSRNVNEWLLDRRNRHVFFIHLFIQLSEHSVPNYDHRAIWIVWTDVVVSASPLPYWSYWSDYEKSSFGRRPFERPGLRWENNIKMDLREVGWGGTGSIWSRIRTGGGHLWMRWWTFGFHKLRGISWLAEDLFSRKPLLHGVSCFGMDKTKTFILLF